LSQNNKKTKKQLIEELDQLRQQLHDLKNRSIKNTGSDKSELRQTNEDLSENENRYRTLFDQSADAILIIEDEQFVDCNSATVEMLGYRNKKELLETHPSELSPETQPDGQSSFDKANEMMSIALNQGSHRFEWDHMRYNGEVFPVEVLLTAVPFQGRTSLHVVWRDITERKQSEDIVKRLAAFAMNNPAPVLRTELDGKITHINPAVRNLLGKEVIDQPIESVLSSFANSRSNPSDISVPSQFEEKLGDEIYLFSIKKDESTRSVYFYGSNITETRRLEQLESRASRLETAGTIAGQVAHDFNNLLGPIVAYPEFIREKLPRNHKAIGYLDDIEKSALKIADINQQLLTLGRRGHYNQKAINLNTIINQAVREMAPMSDKVSLEIDLDPNIMTILGGDSQIHRVITNLLCNAFDALQGIGHISVRTENYYADDVSCTYGRVPKGEYVKLTISDTGSGISEDIVQKILDPFFTTKNSDKQRGSGLGLSVVDAVIKDHNGYLDLVTKSGKGTSFYIYFPITQRTSDEDQFDEASSGSETILVVDDDEIQRDVSTQILKRLKYKVSTVESGEQAIEFLRENPIDLVILDMIMPGGIDGAETYRQILEISHNQKAIIVSGFSESERVKVAQELGAGEFVKKPLTKKAIATAVRIELDREAKVLA